VTAMRLVMLIVGLGGFANSDGDRLSPIIDGRGGHQRSGVEIVDLSRIIVMSIRRYNAEQELFCG